MPLSDNVTALLVQWSQGNQAALEQLTPLVYAELHRLAAAYLRGERDDHTLQATALVHEAYLQMRRLDRVEWKNRAHFIAISARTMRRILVDHARKHIAQKRSGYDGKVSLDSVEEKGVSPNMNLAALDEALDKFAQEYPRQAQVVDLRFFGGLTTEETVEVLSAESVEVSSRTVERDWRFARAWLHKAMAPGDAGLPA